MGAGVEASRGKEGEGREVRRGREPRDGRQAVGETEKRAEEAAVGSKGRRGSKVCRPAL